jgi:hypothetical protein
MEVFGVVVVVGFTGGEVGFTAVLKQRLKKVEVLLVDDMIH